MNRIGLKIKELGKKSAQATDPQVLTRSIWGNPRAVTVRQRFCRALSNLFRSRELDDHPITHFHQLISSVTYE